MPGDWLKLHRKLLRSAVFEDSDLLKLWVFCLLKANWKDCTVFWEGMKTPIHLKRGQFITGRQALYAEFYPKKRVQRKSSRTIWRWLQALQTLGNISIASVQSHSVVTICHYETYQGLAGEDVQPVVQAVSKSCPSRVQAIGSPVSTEEEGKNNEEPKEGKERRKKKKDAIQVAFPDVLDTERFRETWADWLTYRADNNRSYKSEVSVKKAFSELSKVGEEIAIAKLDEAIANGWHGFHLDSRNGKPAANNQKLTGREKNAFTELWLRTHTYDPNTLVDPPPAEARELLRKDGFYDEK